MRNLSMDALRAFVTIADLGGVTNAADHLGRSQPALSLQIKKLEETLNAELFIRFNKQLKLSEQGVVKGENLPGLTVDRRPLFREL